MRILYLLNSHASSQYAAELVGRLHFIGTSSPKINPNGVFAKAKGLARHVRILYRLKGHASSRCAAERSDRLDFKEVLAKIGLDGALARAKWTGKTRTYHVPSQK